MVIDKMERMRQLERYHKDVQTAFNMDSYRNMLNKVGTRQDNSNAWQWIGTNIDDDMTLSSLYIGNGLFGKIIDLPAEDALSKGFDLSDLGDEIEKKVLKKLEKLHFTEKLILGEKWARLYGGAIGVMLINDGRGLEEPLDTKNIQSIEDLLIYERAVVQPDYTSFEGYFDYLDLTKGVPFGQPLWYDVYSQYGQFRVHSSRCLIFKNGQLPEFGQLGFYKYWGIPEYTRIKNELRETITSHRDGTKLLERSVLGVYKMKNLSNLLSTDQGEEKVIQRLHLIDEARNIINSMAIDTDGEDYQYINAAMGGAKDLIDANGEMLSAVSNIPQTLLFGASPTGMNATGDADLESYHKFLGRIQTQNYKSNAEKVIAIVLTDLKVNGDIDKEVPEYEVRFTPFKQLTEEEQAGIDSTKAATELTKAQTAQVYIDMQALDPQEVRAKLAEADEYQIQGIVDENNINLPSDTFNMGQESEDGIDSGLNCGKMSMDGGARSGNFGHAGRPGQRGGSAPKSNASVGSAGKSVVAAGIKLNKVDTKTFSEAVVTAKSTLNPQVAWRVTAHTQEELENEESLKGAQLYVTDGGSTVAVTKAGDIVSVCRNANDDVRGKQLVQAAFELGGDHLDSYEGNHIFYMKCGLVPVSGCDFNKQYAPDDWKEGYQEEAVIFYKKAPSGTPIPKVVPDGASKQFAEEAKKAGAWFDENGYDKAQAVRDSQLGGGDS